MDKRVKRRRPRTTREEDRAESPSVGRGPERPQDLATITWLLAPERMEILRRQLVDGTARDIERSSTSLRTADRLSQKQSAGQ